MSVDLVIPTIGRDSLRLLLDSIARSSGTLPNRIVLADDRRAGEPLQFGSLDERVQKRISVVHSNGGGPAAARNAGWRACNAEWIAFLDDDVVVEPEWLADLAADLAQAGAQTAGVQGTITVPLPRDRAASDWERNVAGLSQSAWITADIVYRRSALERVGGFDERFRRAYREDADLALRMLDAGYALTRGKRRALHPVRPADRWISVRLQAGNADDVLMRALHGPAWRERAHAPRGRFPMHALTVGSAIAALGFFTLWAAATAQFAWKRIAPGPRTPDEIRTMLLTSAAIPFAAVYHRARGTLRVARMPAEART